MVVASPGGVGEAYGDVAVTTVTSRWTETSCASGRTLPHLAQPAGADAPPATAADVAALAGLGGC